MLTILCRPLELGHDEWDRKTTCGGPFRRAAPYLWFLRLPRPAGGRKNVFPSETGILKIL